MRPSGPAKHFTILPEKKKKRKKIQVNWLCVRGILNAEAILLLS